ncbi:MAG: tetratricopeptide repeat protein [Thermoguttaceae bacterium]
MPGGHPYAGHPSWHGAGHPVYGWYHGDWHDHWNRPWHYGPVGWFSVGFMAGAVVWDAPWYWGYWPYYNPYYTEVVVVPGGVVIDYSRPIVVAAPPAGSIAAANQATLDAEASRLLEAARSSFSRGDYPMAMLQVNQAIAKQPNDGVLHETRALILFATKQYKAAAAAAYAVLSVGPGWDWATLCGFYPNPEVYTSQLRELEQYRNANPNMPELHFLAAYHYMTCGHADAAARELQAVVQLNPKDQLSKQLLAGLSGQAAPTETVPSPAATPTTPALPVSAAALAGNWDASRPDGSTFDFTLTETGTYSWKYTRGGQTQEFTGAYSVAEGLLILKRNGNPVMIGQITLTDPNHFNFKLAADNPADPGLAFSRR